MYSSAPLSTTMSRPTGKTDAYISFQRPGLLDERPAGGGRGRGAQMRFQRPGLREESIAGGGRESSLERESRALRLWVACSWQPN